MEHLNKATLGSGRKWENLNPEGNLHQVYPRINNRKVIHTTPYQNLFYLRAEFDGFYKDYYVNKGHNERAGLVLDNQGSILLVSQYRLLVDKETWEVPGGAIEDGEDPAEAAIRECYEETGVLSSSPKKLLFMHMGLDSYYAPTYLFYSNTILGKQEEKIIHTQEVTGWNWVPTQKCVEMIEDGLIVDTFSISALLRYFMLLRK